MAEQPLRVSIVSRQEVVARGLTAMLSDYPDRITVTAIPSARGRVRGVDLVLYDSICLHNDDGSELDHLIQNTGVKVLFYSRDMRPDLRALAVAKGVTAWVSMSTRTKELIEAIELVAAGKPLPDQEDRLAINAKLSAREVEILALIAQGHSNQHIVERLHLTINTLKSHIRSIYRKIGVASRAQAVGWAMQHGFAPPDRASNGTWLS